jgi:hypothetical protein
LKHGTPPSSLANVKDASPGDAVYDALARAKVLTAQFAMHLDNDWRRKLFAQLDSLHDVEEWEAGDRPLQEASFVSFIRTMLVLKPAKRPGLGLSQGGHLIGAWTEGHDRLTIEFLPGDQLRWVLSCSHDDQVERHAAQTAVTRLPEVLAPYKPERWFSRADRQPPAQ